MAGIKGKKKPKLTSYHIWFWTGGMKQKYVYHCAQTEEQARVWVSKLPDYQRLHEIKEV